ncbi:baseplate J/gp47 family protein [Cytobacillus sp. Hm23]
MYEHKTFKVILQEMLDEVPDDVDKLEGSVIYDALAPAAMKLAETYAELDTLLRLTFADTADGNYLERRVGEHGVYRNRATNSIRKGIFTNKDSQPLDISLNSRFVLNDIVYKATEKVIDGEYQLIAETPGVVGNQDYGDLLPIEPIQNLGNATLSEVLIPGEDDESDPSLYAKYVDSLDVKPFGGNRADYQEQILKVQGIGGVRLYRTPFGGGTVKAVIIDSTFNAPSNELINLVQETVDPIEETGEGYGTAPIGHTVTIEGVEAVAVDISTSLTLNNVTLGQVEPMVQEVIDLYLAEIRKEWNKEDSLVIRVSHLESRILGIEGVVDITSTTLNGLAENLTLESEIPVKGGVVIS